MRIVKIIKLINKPLKYKNLRIFERYMKLLTNGSQIKNSIFELFKS